MHLEFEMQPILENGNTYGTRMGNHDSTFNTNLGPHPSLRPLVFYLIPLISRVQLVLRDVRARLADWAPRGLSHSCITSRTDCARAALVRVHTDRPSR